MERGKIQACLFRVMPPAVHVDVSAHSSCMMEDAAGNSDNPLSLHRAGGSLAGATDRFLCVKYSLFGVVLVFHSKLSSW